jgi:hypothetical protein
VGVTKQGTESIAIIVSAKSITLRKSLVDPRTRFCSSKPMPSVEFTEDVVLSSVRKTFHKHIISFLRVFVVCFGSNPVLE